MDSLKKMLCVLIVIFLAINTHAQVSSSVVSGNSKFVASIKYKGRIKPTNDHEYSVKVYSVAYNSLIQDIKVYFASRSAIDSIALSGNGKLLYVHQEPEHRVYNVRTGKLVARFNVPVKVAFGNQDNFFVVATASSVNGYDSYTGEVLDHYQIASDNGINRLIITPDDGHIFGLTNRGQIIVWKKGLEKARKKFIAAAVAVDTDGKQFTVTTISGSTLSTYTYTLPEFKRLKRQTIEKILREKARKETLELRKADPSKRSVIIQPSKLIPEGYKLSSVGNYLAFFAQSPVDEKEVHVLNTLTGELILDDVVGTMKQKVDLKWYNDSLMIPENAIKAGVYNASQAHYDKQLELDFFTEDKIREKKLIEGRKVSNNFKFSSLEQNTNLLLRGTQKDDWQVTIPNHKTLGFSPNSAYNFVENSENGLIGYVKTEEILSGRAPEIIYFSEDKRDYLEEPVIEDVRPAGLNYNRIINFKHISEAKADDSLHVIMKTIEAGKTSGVQVQLIDKNGVYYYGAGAADMKRIWCNLMVKNGKGKVRQVDNFTVTENRGTDTLPNAVSVVLDYSGSMGWARVDALQDGAEKFIKSKRPEDLIAIVKYDHHVQLESRPIKDPQKLLKRLYFNDFSKFGGSTALLDAINSGIFSVQGEENVGKKIVIVMTDGFENASLATRNEVLAHAISGGVNIYTVGFGSLVDEDYLKSLSYTTMGGFYHIFETSDFNWVFNDIYSKATNYYTINYDAESTDSQVYMLKVCLENGVADSMVVKYDNNPADVALLLSDDNNFKPNPVKAYGIDEIDTREFDKPEITNFSKVKVRQPLQPKRFRLDEDRVTTMEEEFSQMKLPKFNFFYDKTETVQETEIRIAELVAFMNKYPDIRLDIIGHTDNTGTLEYNEKLSMDRATMVKGLITAKGVKSDRLVAKGYGETSPVSDNETEEGKAKNRRVEFRIIDKDQ